MTEKKRYIKWEECDWFDEENTGDQDDKDNISESDDEMRMLPKLGKVISTPLGLMKYSNRMSPIDDTDFFIGHVNFNLDNDCAKILNEAEGVEFLKILSRYRFIIGIGHMFEADEVLAEINKLLQVTELEDTHATIQPSTKKEQIPESIINIVNEISERAKNIPFWAAYIFPNGQVLFKKASSKDEEDSIVEEYKNLQLHSAGLIHRQNHSND